MKTASITLGGVTAASKAKSILASNGVHAKLIKFTSLKKGCNYGLSIKESEFYEAARILRSVGIEYTLYKDDNP